MSSCRCLSNSCVCSLWTASLRVAEFCQKSADCWDLSWRSSGGVSINTGSQSCTIESQCWTFTVSDLPWRFACQNVKITWHLVCSVWLLERLRWNNVTHWFYVLLLILDFWKCNFWLDMAKKILWWFSSAVRNFADRWIDSKWKWRLEKTFQ